MAHDANGTYIGLGVGDVSAEVLALKQFFLKKFASTAAPLSASVAAGGTAAVTYDQTMVDFVTRLQSAYGDNSKVNPGLTISGIIDNAWKIRSGYLAPPKVVIFTWQGTGVDMWDDLSPQPYGAAEFVQQMYPNNCVVQPVGNYPAAVVPMGSSVTKGVMEVVRLMTGSSGPGPFFTSGPTIFFGYSQGGICASHTWRDHVLKPGGELNHREQDVIAAVTFGNPCRSPGIARGNDADTSGLYGPVPTLNGQVTGGISGPDCLTAEQTPPWWYDYVWLGSDKGKTELYTMAPVGADPWTSETAQGKAGTIIYDIVMDPSFGDLIKVAEGLGIPLGAVEEIYQAITFAAKGPNADHFSYNWLPAIMYLQWTVKTWTANYVTSGGAITGPPLTVAA